MATSAATGTSIGTGIVLFTAGAILTWAIEADIPYVNEHALGIVLMIVGVVAIGLSLFMEFQRTRSRHVVDYRHGSASGTQRVDYYR
jgi:hypothetical protein